MPVDFLPDERAQSYGRYAGGPSDIDLARVFHLDDADQTFIAAHRGDHNQLGVALQLTTLRFLGTFLADPGEAPATVVATLAAQLGIAEASCLERYRTAEARWDHAAEIRQRFGYRDFHDQPGYTFFVRWLYARAWTGAERPSVLFELAVARLMAQKVVLPGLTTLTRLVARVRERANERLWRRLAALPSPDQRAALERLLLVAGDDATRQTPLDRLRRGPTTVTSVSLVAALKRLEEIRALGVGDVDLTGVPPGRLRALARYAMVSRAQALSQMAPDRRLATLLAFARALEATATDEALDVFDRLLDDLFHEAVRSGKKTRLETIRDLDVAALVLRDVARVVRDPHCRDPEVRAIVATLHGEATIDAAIAVVDALARPPDDHYQREIVAQYPTLRRFLPTLLRTLRFDGIPGTRPLREALAFLAALDGPPRPTSSKRPLLPCPKRGTGGSSAPRGVPIST